MRALFLSLAASFSLFSQEGKAQSVVTADSVRTIVAPPKPKPPIRRVVKPKPKPINREFSGGLQINSDGYSVILERGNVRTEETGERANMFYNVRSFSLEFTEHFSPNELKTSQGTDPSQTAKSQSYTYGKVNNFYAVKLGMNFRRMIGGKPEPNTVSIHWVNGGGLAVGLVKPYYVMGFSPTSGALEPLRYNDVNASTFLDVSRVTGRAPLTEGLSETKVNIGLHYKTALRFDFANNKKMITALETGITAEYYTQAVEIMATKKPQSLFLNVYAAIHFGKRYAGKRD